MFKYSLFIISILNIAFADVSGADLWSQATNDTRTAAAAIQNQVIAHQAAEQAKQNAVQDQMQQTLNTLQAQQKAFLNNQTNTNPAPNSFQAQPVQTNQPALTNNPWAKPNPWQNSQQNPYAGQQYAPQPGLNAPAPGSKAQSNSNNQNAVPNSIYVNPNSTQQNSNAVNIYQ